MFVLHLVFVLSTSLPEGPVFADRYLSYETQTECRTAMQWWIDNPQAQFGDMDPAFDLLIRPIPASNCQPSAPAVG